VTSPTLAEVEEVERWIVSCPYELYAPWQRGFCQETIPALASLVRDTRRDALSLATVEQLFSELGRRGYLTGPPAELRPFEDRV